MAVEFIKYEPWHAEQIKAEGSPEPSININLLPEKWAHNHTAESPALTGIVDGRIVGCSGLDLWWPGMAEGWVVLVHDIIRYRMALRKLKKRMLLWMDEYQLDRIQAPLRADFPEGIRLAEFLGFESETPEDKPMRFFHYDGCDAYMYAIIRKEADVQVNRLSASACC